jgi:hypothetical protein
MKRPTGKEGGIEPERRGAAPVFRDQKDKKARIPKLLTAAERFGFAEPGQRKRRSKNVFGPVPLGPMLRVGRSLYGAGLIDHAVASIEADQASFEIALQREALASDLVTPEEKLLIQEFIAKLSRKYSDLVSPETVQNSPVEGRISPNPQDLSEVVDLEKRAEFHALADYALKHLSIAEFRKAIEDKLTAKAQSTARETTGRRAKQKTRPKTEPIQLSTEQVHLTAARQRTAFEIRARDSDLDNPNLNREERRRRAKNLVQTYDRLRKHDPSYQDDSGIVQRARSILNKSNYRPRGLERA